MRFIFLTLLISLSISSAIAQDPAVAQDADQSPQPTWNDYYARRAGQYKITSTADKTAQFQLRAAPLLTYTNPVRGRDQHGAVFAWTRDGRPEVLGTLWSIQPAGRPFRRVAHEIHSVAALPLEVECPAVDDPDARRADALEWTLTGGQSGLTLTADNLRRPTESQPRRLTQIRQIAAKLSAVVIDRADGTERPLRLMPSPLLRYQSPSLGVIDGAVFAFVLATDPELLVLVEAIKESSNAELDWRIQPARFTGTEVRLEHDQAEIWRCDKIDYKNQIGPYRLKIAVSEINNR